MNYEFDKKDEYELIQKRILIKPDKCPLCGKGNLSINKYSKGQKANICFRSMAYKCKKMIPIRQNSFFKSFNKIKIEECMEITKCFITLNLNAKKAYTNLIYNIYLKISLKQYIS